MKRSSAAHGFTLVELLIVVSILGIIALVIFEKGGLFGSHPHQRCRDLSGDSLQRYEQCVRREADDE